LPSANVYANVKLAGFRHRDFHPIIHVHAGRTPADSADNPVSKLASGLAPDPRRYFTRMKEYIMKTLEEIKNSLNLQKQLLKEKYKVKTVGIFGSYLRNEQTDKSDIDILIDYEETPSLITLIELEYYLEEVLNSKVDLVTSKGIKPPLRESILREVVYI
jgi:uncharacterized protein